MPEEIYKWLSGAALVISVLTTVYAWMTSRAKLNSEHLKAVDKDLADHDRRIQTVENELKHLPDKDDVNELKIALTEVRGEMGQVRESVKGISSTVDRVESYLTSRT